MKFYSFGQKEKPSLFLIPGTGGHWKNNFGHVIEELKKSFYVVCASYDGFDETEETTFETILDEVKKIEDYILKEFNGKVAGMYGCSLGGSLVGHIVSRKRVLVQHAIIGSSDMDEVDEGVKAKFETWLITNILYKPIKTGRIPKFYLYIIRKKLGADYAKGIKRLIGGYVKLEFLKKKNLYNQFYSDLVTKLPHQIERKGTIIHCMYATKMGEAYLKRYRLFFKNPDIYTMEGLQHEELLLVYPKEWVKAIKQMILV